MSIDSIQYELIYLAGYAFKNMHLRDIYQQFTVPKIWPALYNIFIFIYLSFVYNNLNYIQKERNTFNMYHTWQYKYGTKDLMDP